jgi:uncharacterized membrane protein
MFVIWVMLAIACFVGAFFTPVMWIKLIGLVFGGMNAFIILSWTITAIQDILKNKKLKSGE